MSVKAKFVPAQIQSPRFKSKIVSKPNADIVLKPPKNPVMRKRRKPELSSQVPRNEIPARQAINMHAIKFAKNVASGNLRVPSQATTATPIPQRKTPPKPAPIKTNNASRTHIKSRFYMYRKCLGIIKNALLGNENDFSDFVGSRNFCTNFPEYRAFLEFEFLPNNRVRTLHFKRRKIIFKRNGRSTPCKFFGN